MAIVAENLDLFYCSLQAMTSPEGNFFHFVNPNQSERPLKLYKNSMTVLVDKLPFAIARAKQMEQSCIPDGTNETIHVIHKRGDFETVLFISMYKGNAYIYLRLFAYKNYEKLPTRHGVRLSIIDSVDQIGEFVKRNNK